MVLCIDHFLMLAGVFTKSSDAIYSPVKGWRNLIDEDQSLTTWVHNANYFPILEVSGVLARNCLAPSRLHAWLQQHHLFAQPFLSTDSLPTRELSKSFLQLVSSLPYRAFHTWLEGKGQVLPVNSSLSLMAAKIHGKLRRNNSWVPRTHQSPLARMSLPLL